MKYKIVIEDEKHLIRADLFVVDYLEEYSRSQVKKMFLDERIKINGNVSKQSYILRLNDVIEIEIIEENKTIEPINLDLEVLFEDEHLLVINKPAGLVVHPSESYKDVTLVNHLLYHTNELSLTGDKTRPGIVHRLDKDTSGLLVVAKTDLAYDFLVSQFKNRTVIREYLAIVNNPFKEDSGTIDAPIMRDKIKMVVNPFGKEAITHFKVLKQNDDFSYIKCQLETGRTHQIRVHLSYINHPIVADEVYGSKKAFKNYRQALHAEVLEFVHPATYEVLRFTKEAPEDFVELLNKVGLNI